MLPRNEKSSVRHFGVPLLNSGSVVVVDNGGRACSIFHSSLSKRIPGNSFLCCTISFPCVTKHTQELTRLLENQKILSHED